MITPLPSGGGVGGGAAIFLTPVSSVLLCFSVRKRTIAKLAGEVFLSQRRKSVTAKLGDEI